MARNAPSSTGDVLLYFMAIFLPPVSVFLKRGCAADFLINICLSILGWIPGVLHAFWIISKYGTPARPKTTVAPNGHMTQKY
ncbi:uncharacterized protein HMPREF1541_01624 [Cyphellophora europaea CBS 101466]|uniref:Plasma membrane proteolipid 3 n=1 Tax=Cyphellophora europaea (strain CBS 101466) TaxID=1220924 RepID=W2S359_CYPE1|nr:uncharacterized protein HMPREF1541_01624 [Cyphellophora europaea CBS 101466]ETN42468.1 hypothetical protein HMPREF1541_01624 [Cyphellophora europaea CBS 101466]